MGDIITQNYFLASFDKRRVAELVDDGDGPQSSIVDDAIAAAEGTVRSYLSKQFTLEQLQADKSVWRAVAVITMHNLESRRSDVSQGILQQFELTMTYLKNLIDGEAKLAAVEQVLPRITQGNAADVFENSGYFSGYPSVDDE